MTDFQAEWNEKRKKQWLKAIGSHIAGLRKKKGISGAEFARRLDEMDKSNYRRMEQGLVNPSVFLVKKICDVLQISMEKFWKDFKEK